VYTTSLQFTGNPGALTPIEVNWYLSGNTATLSADSVSIRSSGTRGEFTDHVPTHCDGVTVTVDFDTGAAQVTIENTDGGSDATNEVYALKSCLGTSDYDDDTNQDVNNWDTGHDTTTTKVTWPHLVKFVEVGSTDGGYYSLLYYDGTDWELMHDVPIAEDDNMEVFTTDATMQLVFDDADDDTHQAASDEDSYSLSDSDTTGLSTLQISGDASCESGDSDVSHCLQKGEVIMLSTDDYAPTAEDDVTGEFYTITRVWTAIADEKGEDDRYYISVDHAVNADFTGGNIYVLKTNDEGYEYVSECSNRGLCNSEEGLCECFKGYTNDNCDMQSAIAV